MCTCSKSKYLASLGDILTQMTLSLFFQLMAEQLYNFHLKWVLYMDSLKWVPGEKLWGFIFSEMIRWERNTCFKSFRDGRPCKFKLSGNRDSIFIKHVKGHYMNSI